MLNAGRLAQVGTPGELYHRPASSFVADFIGQTNLMPGTLLERNGQTVRVDTPAGPITAATVTSAAELPQKVVVSIRPEQMQIVRNGAAAAPNRNRFVGKPIETTFLGEASEHVLIVNNHRVKVISAPPLFDVPEQLAVEFDPEDVIVLTE